MPNNNGATSTGGSFPAANKFLQKKWNDKAYKLHRDKVKTTKTKLDTTKPKECPHLHLNLKKIQMEEEKQALIDRDNRILLSKLTNVLRSDGSVDNWNYEYEARPRTLHAPQMQREQERIAKENEHIMKRLNNARGTYSFQKLEDDYLMHEYYKSLKAQETKTYELQARALDEEDGGPSPRKPADKTTREQEGDQEDGEGATAAAEGEDKLPAMEETKKKPPPVRRTLKRQPTKLPLLGAERRKEEDKKKKEAISKPSPYDEREDAGKLFKAIKGMLKAEPVLTQVLARRTYAQRQQTIAKFNQQYELDLEEDFKDQLDDEFGDFVSALLARREEVDAMALNHALKGHASLAETFIEILCTRNNTALGIIKSAYHRLYGVELEEDIKSEVKGQLKHMFLALVKGSRNEKMTANNDVAEMDARELVDDENDRWSVNGEKLGELLVDASFDHIRAVFQQYSTMTDWTILSELKRVLTGDYKDAMIALVKCLDNCASFMAEQVHKALIGEADDSTLTRIMITRSEIDMLQIRRQFKKKYGETLTDGIETKCRSPIKKALVQMVIVHGVSQEEKDAWKKEAESKQVTLPKVVSPEKIKLRGPQPDKMATLPDDNPLVRSTRSRFPKSPVRRVVTPRGMNKTPSSRTSSGGRINTKKPAARNNKTTTPKSRQPTKPIQSAKLAPVLQKTQPKSPTKPVKPSAPSQQKQTVIAKQEKPKSSDSSRTKSSKSVERDERTSEIVPVKNETVSKDTKDETSDKDANPKKEEAASDQPSSTTDQGASDDNEAEIQPEQVVKDNNEAPASSAEKDNSGTDTKEEADDSGSKGDGDDDKSDEVKGEDKDEEQNEPKEQHEAKEENVTEQGNTEETTKDKLEQKESESQEQTESQEQNNEVQEQKDSETQEQAGTVSQEQNSKESLEQSNNEPQEQNSTESSEQANNASQEQNDDVSSQEQNSNESQEQKDEQNSSESEEQKDEESTPAAVSEKVVATGGEDEQQTTKVEE